jgi:DNA repair protein RecO (recombination protein O)
MRYKKLLGIILKKQNYKEADQILTVWSREEGKIRLLARGLRKTSSKLNYALPDLGLAELHFTGTSLPLLIGAKPVKTYRSLSEDLQKTIIGFYAAELMLKMTADEHPNPEAFELMTNFLENLDQADYSARYQPLLECFSLELLDCLGFKMPQNITSSNVMRMDGDEIEAVHSTINKFIEYVLERPVWTTKF